MTGTVDERLAAALHEMEGPGRHSRPRLTRQICPGPDYHDADAAKVLAALADSGVVLVEREALGRAIDDAMSAMDDEWLTNDLADETFRVLRESR